jgi:hypothetical protein
MQGDMTEMTPIVTSMHTSNDSLQKRRVPLGAVTSIEIDSSDHSDMMEMTPIVNSVHTSNDSLHC